MLGIKIKPLVWADAGFEQCASNVAGYYRVFERDGLWRAVVHTRADAYFIAETETEEAAKERAQADYSARILAALEAPDAGVVAELVEAVECLLSCEDPHHVREARRLGEAVLAKIGVQR